MGDHWTLWETFGTAPTQNAAQSASSCRVLACTTTTASKALINDVLVSQPVPNQPASELGELPASGAMLCRFHAKGGDIWILFGPNSSVVVDPTDTTAAQLGDRIPQDQYVDYVLNPATQGYFSARTASGTATLKYRASGPPTNNRP